MLVKTYCAAVNGLEVTTVTIEVSMNPGVMYRFTGLGDTAVREGRDRIAAALQQTGYKFPHGDITVNMAPADLRQRAIHLIILAITDATAHAISSEKATMTVLGRCC